MTPVFSMDCGSSLMQAISSGISFAVGEGGCKGSLLRLLSSLKIFMVRRMKSAEETIAMIRIMVNIIKMIWHKTVTE